MLSRGERIFWGGLAAAVIAGAAAAWWTADQWTPHAAPWAAQVWRKITRPGPACQAKCCPRMPASSNIPTRSLPNTARSLSSATMVRLSCGSCRLWALM